MEFRKQPLSSPRASELHRGPLWLPSAASVYLGSSQPSETADSGHQNRVLSPWGSRRDSAAGPRVMGGREGVESGDARAARREAFDFALSPNRGPNPAASSRSLRSVQGARPQALQPDGRWE